jgi:hypothetical protein
MELAPCRCLGLGLGGIRCLHHGLQMRQHLAAQFSEGRGIAFPKN